MLPGNSLDEVFPNLFIGEESAARDLKLLKRMNVTHVLNAAKGKTVYHVNTDEDFYKPVNIQFMSIKAYDGLNFKMSPYFNKAAEFIAQGLASGGKVLVHCREGVSRSATLVLAYLMIKEGMTVQDAVRTVRKSREICPNEGFLQQLCDLNKELQQKDSKTPHGVADH